MLHKWVYHKTPLNCLHRFGPWCGVVLSCVMWYIMVGCDVAWCCVMWFSMAWWDVLCCCVAWCDLVLCVVLLCDVVLCDVVLYGVVCRGVVCINSLETIYVPLYRFSNVKKSTFWFSSPEFFFFIKYFNFFCWSKKSCETVSKPGKCTDCKIVNHF